MKLLLMAATAFVLLQAPSQLVKVNDYAAQAASHSESAGLHPIAAAPATSEIRVWRPETLIGPTVGWVVTSDKIIVYSGDSALRPSATFRTPKARRILRAFNKLSHYNGQWLACTRMKDGWGLVVEGSDSSSPFAFATNTPNLCAEGGAHEVWLAYSLLLDATGGAP
ncbi:hypothetical protein [Lysobacter terrae]